MNLSDLSLEAAVLKVLADEIAARQKAVKDQLDKGFKATGTTQAVPRLPDGTKVATVSLAGGDGKSPSVTAELPFLNWVAKNYPDEIDFRVRDNFKEKLFRDMKAAGRAVDPKTGQVVPGITMRNTTSYITVRSRPGGPDAIVAAWRDGQLRDVQIVAPLAIEDVAEAAA